MTKTAAIRLQKELKAVAGLDWVHVQDVENLFHWKIALMSGNPISVYYGCYLKARLDFPSDFPWAPPVFTFVPKIWHPNVVPAGDQVGQMCISTLRRSGPDPVRRESAVERWNPVLSVEAILAAIMSVLEDPIIDDGMANERAGVTARYATESYHMQVLADIFISLRDRPAQLPHPKQVIMTVPWLKRSSEKRWVDDNGRLVRIFDREDVFNTDLLENNSAATLMALKRKHGRMARRQDEVRDELDRGIKRMNLMGDM